MSRSMTERVAEHWVRAPYYDNAEKSEVLDVFWEEQSIFYPLFNKLDATHIVELACGHGRHVRKYINRCETLLLVDVLQENIEFCRNRFRKFDNVDYIINSGSDFSSINSETKTAIFSYDAMVHFELHDIDAYLKDAFRILVPGGKLLLHHSNYSANPGAFYQENPGWRNFMSANIFAHLAIRAGFKILSQTVINWNIANLDCVSFCQKP